MFLWSCPASRLIMLPSPQPRRRRRLARAIAVGNQISEQAVTLGLLQAIEINRESWPGEESRSELSEESDCWRAHRFLHSQPVPLRDRITADAAGNAQLDRCARKRPRSPGFPGRGFFHVGFVRPHRVVVFGGGGGCHHHHVLHSHEEQEEALALPVWGFFSMAPMLRVMTRLGFISRSFGLGKMLPFSPSSIT